MTKTAKQIAWNGVCFEVPDDWEVGQIGTRHLILEDDTGPVMEIKWGLVKRKFSHQAQLKRLSAVHSRQLSDRVKQWTLPSDWQFSLTDFEVTGFSWQGTDTGARGVILFCSKCRNATLIQFFHATFNKIPEIFSEVLRSFRDHRDDGQIRWAIFDIRAVTPATHPLRHYRFEAGIYELVFAAGKEKIMLYRWGLASVLLAKDDLLQFAKKTKDLGKGQPSVLLDDNRKAIEWNVFPATIWQRWMGRLSPSPSYRWLRLWHLADKNRILGVQAEGRRSLNAQLLTRICDMYESL